MKKTYSLGFLMKGGLSESEALHWKKLLDAMDRKEARWRSRIRQHERNWVTVNFKGTPIS